MKRSALGLFALFLFAVGLGGPAFAQNRELLGTFQDWNSFRETQGDNIVCYAVAIPGESQLSRRGRQRGDVYFFVTTWKELDVRDQVNVVVGYPIDEDSTPTIRIGNETFEMFGRGDRTWLMDSDQTDELLGAMRRGSRMTVTGRSERGTDSTDNYSLLGATAALQSASGACR